MDGSLPKITVVIVHRHTEDASTTLESLKHQTFKDFKVVVVSDEGNGSNWARNQGFKQVDTEFVLFSDNDITWKSNAFKTLLETLQGSTASYCYGRYSIDGVVHGHHQWNAQLLQKENYISTMTLIRTKDFPCFDESIKRLQDWDLWLTMLKQGKKGIYCEDLIFTTTTKPGISNGNSFTYLDAALVIKDKHFPHE